MLRVLQILGWLVCAAYSTIPGYWLLIHRRAHYWRARRSPYRLIFPLWIVMMVVVVGVTAPWRSVALYRNGRMWIPAGVLFAVGFRLYRSGGADFSLKQLQGIPEISAEHPEQRLVTNGIRARVRHPVYLAHLCEMLAWTMGTGLAVCFGLTAFTMITGAIMIRAEDTELEQRFGEPYRKYREKVPAIVPKL